MPDKIAACQFRHEHAIRRAWERYGLEINELTLQHIGQYIRAGKSFILFSDPHRLICELDFMGTIVRVVYLPEAGIVATFLPRDLPIGKRNNRINRTKRDGKRYQKGWQNATKIQDTR